MILGFVVLFALTDTPELAGWLAAEQRTWLSKRLATERTQRETVRHYGLGETFRNGRVWALTLVYFGQNVSGYGFVIFLPQIIKRFGVSDVQTGFINAIPFAFAAVAMVLWGLHSDRTGERNKHCAAACMLNFITLAACTLVANPYLLMLLIILSQMGQSAIAPTFWALPTAMLSGAAAAGGIAMINAVGNLGGFLGPYAMGYIRDATGNFNLGLLFISCGALVAGIVVLALGHDRRLERIEGPAATPAE